jgi:hypothetical protein
VIVHDDSDLVSGTYSSARVGARNRPSGLGDPDPLAGRYSVDGVAGVGDGLPEDVCGVLDGGVLEVGVAGEDISIKHAGSVLARSAYPSMPMKSEALMTTSLAPSTQAVQVSTCPTSALTPTERIMPLTS